MMEFNNRIDAQRKILTLVNRRSWNEELYGLSNGAIDRWIQSNKVDPSDKLVRYIYEAASKLFFLANKSQEQVTNDYRALSMEVHYITEKISTIIEN